MKSIQQHTIEWLHCWMLEWKLHHSLHLRFLLDLIRNRDMYLHLYPCTLDKFEDFVSLQSSESQSKMVLMQKQLEGPE